MTHDKSLTTYVDSETKTQLKREADERGLSFAAYLRQLIDRGRMAEAEESLTSRTDAEAALERVVQQTLSEYHDDLLAAVEKSSVYSVANFELLAGTDGFGVSGARRNDVFSTGRRRTHTPLSEHEETMADDSTTDDAPSGDKEPESESDDDDENDTQDSGASDIINRLR
jgi:hypothetical protein